VCSLPDVFPGLVYSLALFPGLVYAFYNRYVQQHIHKKKPTTIQVGKHVPLWSLNFHTLRFPGGSLLNRLQKGGNADFCCIIKEEAGTCAQLASLLLYPTCLLTSVSQPRQGLDGLSYCFDVVEGRCPSAFCKLVGLHHFDPHRLQQLLKGGRVWLLRHDRKSTESIAFNAVGLHHFDPAGQSELL